MPLKIFSVIALLLPVVTIAEEPASSLRVEPAEVVLHGHRSSQQLLVSEPQSGGVLADVTREVRFESIAPAMRW